MAIFRQHRCCKKQGMVRMGTWSAEEDAVLRNYIFTNGVSNWLLIPEKTGLQRCGKSCRLRWLNYLRPDINRGPFSNYEVLLIIHLHKRLGNKWAQIAKHLPGRTGNDIKNLWNFRIKKRLLNQQLPTDTFGVPNAVGIRGELNYPNPNLMGPAAHQLAQQNLVPAVGGFIHPPPPPPPPRTVMEQQQKFHMDLFASLKRIFFDGATNLFY